MSPLEASWTSGVSSVKDEDLLRSEFGAAVIHSLMSAGSHMKSVRQSSKLKVPLMDITAIQTNPFFKDPPRNLSANTSNQLQKSIFLVNDYDITPVSKNK